MFHPPSPHSPIYERTPIQRLGASYNKHLTPAVKRMAWLRPILRGILDITSGSFPPWHALLNPLSLPTRRPPTPTHAYGTHPIPPLYPRCMLLSTLMG